MSPTQKEILITAKWKRGFTIPDGFYIHPKNEKGKPPKKDLLLLKNDITTSKPAFGTADILRDCRKTRFKSSILSYRPWYDILISDINNHSCGFSYINLLIPVLLVR